MIWLRRLTIATAAALAGIVLLVLLQAYPSTEAVRLRNALLISDEPITEFNWDPARAPAVFRQESLPPPPLLALTAKQIQATVDGDDLDLAKALVSHLIVRARGGGPVQSLDPERNYRAIVEEGRGYCSDFVDAFVALALASGLPVRVWAFSLDGFGGHGHAVAEIFDRVRRKWVMLDVFNNVYPVDRATRAPLSALELRDALLGRGPPAEFVRIGPGRLGYKVADKLVDYYRGGLSQWYLWLGNNVISRARHPLVRAADRVATPLGELQALLAGEYPGIAIWPTPENRVQHARMLELRHRLALAGTLGMGLVAVLVALIVAQIGLARFRRGAAAVRPGMRHDTDRLRVALIGPLPPPPGGMANQCQQLARLLEQEQVEIVLVRTNADYRPRWAGRIKGLRAAFRLVWYLRELWHAAGRVDLFHVFANSGWAWHLFAAPAVLVAKLRGVPVLVNYRGGNAGSFLRQAPFWVRSTLAWADSVVVPSQFLHEVFRGLPLMLRIIPNVVDLQRFRPREAPAEIRAPHVVVTRHLEPIYDIPTALRALALVRRQTPSVRMTVAGTGPELPRLRELCRSLGLEDAVAFAGQLDNDQMASLYHSADVVLNPSQVDNMPISILEAFASGVPVVSTNVGGVPFLAEHGRTALLVPAGEPESMAAAIGRLLRDPDLAQGLRTAAGQEVRKYTWTNVRNLLLEEYQRLARNRLLREHSA